MIAKRVYLIREKKEEADKIFFKRIKKYKIKYIT